MTQNKFIAFRDYGTLTDTSSMWFTGFGAPAGQLSYQLSGTSDAHVFNAWTGSEQRELMRITGAGVVSILSGLSAASVTATGNISSSGTVSGTNITTMAADAAASKATLAAASSLANPSTLAMRGSSGGCTFGLVVANAVNVANDVTVGTILNVAGRTTTAGLTNSLGLNFTTPTNKMIALSDSGSTTDLTRHDYDGLGASTNVVRYQAKASTTDHVFSAATSSSASTTLMSIKGNGTVIIPKVLYMNGSAQKKMIVLHDAGVLTDTTQYNFNGLGMESFQFNYNVADTNNSHVWYVATSATTRNEVFRIAGNGNISTTGPLSCGAITSSGTVSGTNITTLTADVAADKATLAAATALATPSTVAKRDGSGGSAFESITTNTLLGGASLDIGSTSSTINMACGTGIQTVNVGVSGGGATAIKLGGSGDTVTIGSALALTGAAGSQVNVFPPVDNDPATIQFNTLTAANNNYRWSIGQRVSGLVSGMFGISAAGGGTTVGNHLSFAPLGGLSTPFSFTATGAIVSSSTVSGTNITTMTADIAADKATLAAATALATASTVAKRDGSGGSAFGALIATSVTSSGTVSGTNITTMAADIAADNALLTAATSSATANTLAKRGATGECSFTALTATTVTASGAITAGGDGEFGQSFSWGAPIAGSGDYIRFVRKNGVVYFSLENASGLVSATGSTGLVTADPETIPAGYLSALTVNLPITVIVNDLFVVGTLTITPAGVITVQLPAGVNFAGNCAMTGLHGCWVL